MIESLAEQRCEFCIEFNHKLVLYLSDPCTAIYHLEDGLALLLSNVGVGILEEEVLAECESRDMVKFPFQVTISHDKFLSKITGVEVSFDSEIASFI